jgi:hypothetical protein
MIMFSWMYSAIFWVIVCLWPFALQERLGEPMTWGLAVANAAMIVFVAVRCSSREIGFVGGLDIIAGSMMSGCANITILYLPPLLLGVYLVAAYHSLVSLARGRDYSQDRWTSLVRRFHKRRPPLAVERYEGSRRDVDPLDPQALLDGASRREMDGDWDQAILLYQMAAERLAGTQDGIYAEDCIGRIREKIAATRGA